LGARYIDEVRIDIKKIIHIYQFLVPLVMEILWMRMDEKGQKNITKVDPPQFYTEWMNKEETTSEHVSQEAAPHRFSCDEVKFEQQNVPTQRF
jgi:hypothetical protein